MRSCLRRREFIAGLGGAAAWPLAARAQQRRMPIIGILTYYSLQIFADRLAAFREGLKETGFAEGQNVSIEYHSTDGHDERLAELAAVLVRRRVAVIATLGGAFPTLAAKAATSTIPIVFVSGGDAVENGFVTSISRPEANLTGSSTNNQGLARKRLQFMRELLPGTNPIAVLMSAANINTAPREEVSLMEAARTLALQLVVFRVVATEHAIDTAFANIVQQRIAALVVSGGLNNRRPQIIALAARHVIPAFYSNDEYVRAGGLISYSSEIYHQYREAGVYAGRILKGDKPADLPVMLPTKYKLAINMKTAKALGLSVPPTLVAIADELIE